ncbi:MULTISPECIES: MFS transporter [unclassified Pseudomonas]|uniref:MFS transporter n=1 Tax=unclassified Pseudomonas TaxID=196821 RepID=UPI0021BB8067|nr:MULTISPECIES: MFS transporter [unclassified Pseudomonas]MCT8162524.1 MFS transporter [Pseudomonas sp. HD6422]MCT8183387.1 MFS transporter [Pseudomonas sp. HD6421]
MNMRLLAGLLFAVSVVGFSLGASLPLVSLRLHEAGAGTLEIGIIAAIPAAGMMLSAFMVDACCRHLTRRTIYLLCFSLCTVSIALLETAFASLWLLAVLRLGLGIGMGIAIILGESWVNELCPDHNRGKIMALYATSFTGFQVLGPALLALLGADSPWIIGVVTLGYGLALLCILLTVPNDHVEHGEEGEKSFGLAGFFRVAPALCVAVLFFSFFDAVVLSLLPVYASSHGFAVGVAALMVTVVFAGDMVFQLPLGWLADRVERTGLHLLCGLVAMAIGIALPWLLDMTWLLWPMLVLLGAVAGAIYTLALVLIGQRFKGQDLVTANASVGLLWGVGSLVGPLLSGAAMDVAPHGLPMALALMAGLFVCFARQSYRRTGRLRAVVD